MITRQRRTASIIAAALVFLVMPSEHVAADEIELLPRWKKDEKLIFEMVKTREDSKDGKTTLKVSTRTELEVEVVKVSKDGYVLRWVTGETKFDDPKFAADPFVRRISNLLQGNQVILEMDSRGSLKGVQNWKEVKETSVKVLDVAMEEMQKAGFDKAMIAKIRAQTVSMVTTKEQVEQLCTREAELLFAVLGQSYAISKPNEFDGVLPNALGGEPFP